MNKTFTQNSKTQKHETRLGEKRLSCENYIMEIINYRAATDLDVKLSDGSIITNINYTSFKNGSVSNPYHPSVYGIGYFGVGKHVAKINGKFTNEYSKWNGIIRRCYSEKELLKHPSYKDVYVCEDWRCFQNFAEWYENSNIEKFEIDKDILIKNNKIYSPETCCFVPHEINILFKKLYKEGGLQTGIKKLASGNFQVRFCASKGRVCKTFKTEELAFEYYKLQKEFKIKELAEKWKNKITLRTYKVLINYKVEIDD